MSQVSVQHVWTDFIFIYWSLWTCFLFICMACISTCFIFIRSLIPSDFCERKRSAFLRTSTTGSLSSQFADRMADGRSRILHTSVADSVGIWRVSSCQRKSRRDVSVFLQVSRRFRGLLEYELPTEKLTGRRSVPPHVNGRFRGLGGLPY